MTTPWDPQHRADPHRFWNEVRTAAPVAPFVGPESGVTFWFATTHEACLEVFRHERIGHRPELHLPPERLPWEVLPHDDPLAMLGRNMLFVDPPDHTRLRRLAAGSFRRSVIARLEPRVEAVTSELLDAIDPSAPFDLVAGLAEPLPVTIIAELLGVPRADQDRFRAWTRAILSPSFQQAQLGAMEFIGYLNDLADARRTDPRDDLVTELVRVGEDGDRLDHTEFLAMVFLLLVAGHETTVNLIGNGTVALSDNGAERERWAGTPGLGPTAVEELIRFCGPVETATMRYAYDDLTIAGAEIAAGSPVIPVLYAANRDPARFEAPDRLDLGRDPNPHLGFGFGIHHCLGAPLARLEATIAFRQLLERFPHLEVVTPRDAIEWPDGFFLRGPRRLDVAA